MRFSDTAEVMWHIFSGSFLHSWSPLMERSDLIASFAVVLNSEYFLVIFCIFFASSRFLKQGFAYKLHAFFTDTGITCQR